MKKWLGRIGLGLAALVLLAVAAGAIAEQLARWRSARVFPLPGKLVDIGGRRIQIDCRGSGSPVVVFEAGGGLWGSLNWAKVQDGVARTTRACSYSRAGILWSDPATGPRNAATIAADLHATLKAAGEHAPFVLVGHSLGGIYTIAYTERFGGEVAGLVLVDPSHPDQTRRAEAITHRPFKYLPTAAALFPHLVWTGLPRLMLNNPPDGAPQDIRDKAWYAPAAFSVDEAVREAQEIEVSFAQVKAAHDLGARPLYVLTAMAPYSRAALAEMNLTPDEGRKFKLAWKTLQDEETSWSRQSQHLLVPDSGHLIIYDKPDVVVHAVASVVESVREKRPLQP